MPEFGHFHLVVLYLVQFCKTIALGLLSNDITVATGRQTDLN